VEIAVRVARFFEVNAMYTSGGDFGHSSYQVVRKTAVRLSTHAHAFHCIFGLATCIFAFCVELPFLAFACRHFNKRSG
jgi:hypothetical protein